MPKVTRRGSAGSGGVHGLTLALLLGPNPVEMLFGGVCWDSSPTTSNQREGGPRAACPASYVGRASGSRRQGLWQQHLHALLCHLDLTLSPTRLELGCGRVDPRGVADPGSGKEGHLGETPCLQYTALSCRHRRYPLGTSDVLGLLQGTRVLRGAGGQDVHA